MLGGGALSLGLSVCIVPPPPFGSPATSLEEERSIGLAPPPRGGFAFLAAPRRQMQPLHHTLVRGKVMCASAVSASEHQRSAELLRTPFSGSPTSQNSPSTHSGELARSPLRAGGYSRGAYCVLLSRTNYSLQFS